MVKITVHHMYCSTDILFSQCSLLRCLFLLFMHEIVSVYNTCTLYISKAIFKWVIQYILGTLH